MKKEEHVFALEHVLQKLREHIYNFNIFFTGVVFGLFEQSAEEVNCMSQDGGVDDGLRFLV